LPSSPSCEYSEPWKERSSSALALAAALVPSIPPRLSPPSPPLEDDDAGCVGVIGPARRTASECFCTTISSHPLHAQLMFSHVPVVKGPKKRSTMSDTSQKLTSKLTKFFSVAGRTQCLRSPSLKTPRWCLSDKARRVFPCRWLPRPAGLARQETQRLKNSPPRAPKQYYHTMARMNFQNIKIDYTKFGCIS
jgi:hypothetical protein